MNRRQFAVLLPVAGLAMGCDTEPEPQFTANIQNNEKIQKALENLASAIGDLEGNVDGLRRGEWHKFITRSRNFVR